MIVWLASYPRSGNTFFRILLYKLYEIETHTIYNEPKLSSLKNSKGLIGRRNESYSIKDMAEDRELFFVKTHALPQGDDYPSIYIVRDGRDAIISYANYITHVLPKNSNRSSLSKFYSTLFPKKHHNVIKNLIVKTKKHNGNWGMHVNQWTEQANNRILIKFEDLISDPVQETTKALEKLNIPGVSFNLKNTKYPSFEELHQDWPDFFRHGKKSGWKDEMELCHQELFWKHHGDVMSRLGYLKS